MWVFDLILSNKLDLSLETRFTIFFIFKLKKGLFLPFNTISAHCGERGEGEARNKSQLCVSFFWNWIIYFCADDSFTAKSGIIAAKFLRRKKKFWNKNCEKIDRKCKTRVTIWLISFPFFLFRFKIKIFRYRQFQLRTELCLAWLTLLWFQHLDFWLMEHISWCQRYKTLFLRWWRQGQIS